MPLQVHQQQCRCGCETETEIDSDAKFVRIKCRRCGQILFFRINEYRVIGHLGKGGMGSVYQVKNSNQEMFAMKVIENPNQRILDHFMRECMIQSQLQHQNIVKSHSQGRYGSIYYIVMEYLDGQSLDLLLKKYRAFPIKDAVRITLSVLSGLNYAHNQFDLVHRDIKPGNIFLTKSNQVKILDLGLAKTVGVSYGLTGEGAIKGSPSYMPHEQFLEAKSVDIRADIYAIGATFYHLLAGIKPFGGLNITQTVIAKSQGKCAPLQDIKGNLPREIVAVVEKAMALSPDERYQNPQEMLNELLEIYNNLQ
ncbi:serine/threonine protein kinase [Candidatus Uabimicrobium amorphum]|uniref:non-specific serine/threonine protein kinase n=1 Tax=Uabimicrobium amorphum TaxID=2596890 RepID=A0A5S9F1X8_UABAM|nr:serine/threonine-protein kinase [Candidatus Uabimicrobium amorphum]BBM82533.1 protein kinase [Candidatus Uabimicrobium amorphum]